MPASSVARSSTPRSMKAISRFWVAVIDEVSTVTLKVGAACALRSRLVIWIGAIFERLVMTLPCNRNDANDFFQDRLDEMADSLDSRSSGSAGVVTG